MSMCFSENISILARSFSLFPLSRLSLPLSPKIFYFRFFWVSYTFLFFRSLILFVVLQFTSFTPIPMLIFVSLEVSVIFRSSFKSDSSRSVVVFFVIKFQNGSRGTSVDCQCVGSIYQVILILVLDSVHRRSQNFYSGFSQFGLDLPKFQ
ncbi:hypothetical protein ES332_D09G096600v1 [Gossypium tomentosum]|uniref:Uncharacterized protein n=1 Tax=Gossypium tomentosum TaxID=34277 RepID=A0A5D2JEU6_GOSTO|nr:hypothetical protein ES332_D09G096600v1 [Gossypium tomentosum]